MACIRQGKESDVGPGILVGGQGDLSGVEESKLGSGWSDMGEGSMYGVLLGHFYIIRQGG